MSARFFIFVILASFTWHASAKDQPQWGQAWNRNMVSEEKNLPAEFDIESGKNVKWTAHLGTESHSQPIISDGRVYIGTNNGEPRNPAHQGDRGVMMCFSEKDGKFLWQLVAPKRSEDPYLDWPNTGMSSPVTVDGNRVYLLTSRGEVVCLDPEGMSNGNDGPFKDESAHQTPAGTNRVEVSATDADIIWTFDLTEGAGIYSHDGAHSSILVDGDFLYLNSGTGVDNTHRKIRTPDAPGIVVLDKKTGRLVARDYENMAPETFHCTWSSPSMGVVKDRKLFFFAGGNGMVYAFEALSQAPPTGKVARLEKVWQFDFDPDAPKTEVHRFTSNRKEGPSNIYGMPVLFDNRLYITGGGDLWWGKNEAFAKCVDPSGTGDITRSGLIWSAPLERHSMSTAAVTEEMVFVSDTAGNLHCLDRATGREIWKHEIGGETWASPYLADGKGYIGTRRGNYWIFAADKEKKVLFHTVFKNPISATTVAANGTLYIATMTRLYAIEKAGK